MFSFYCLLTYLVPSFLPLLHNLLPPSLCVPLTVCLSRPILLFTRTCQRLVSEQEKGVGDVRVTETVLVLNDLSQTHTHTHYQ